MTLMDQRGTWLMYMVADRLQNHIPKGIWDTTEGDDVAFVSQFVARDNGSNESLQV